MPQSQRDRLAFIDLRVGYLGDIKRNDLVTRFGIQIAAATRDLAKYKELAPNNLIYDGSGKCYTKSPHFREIFDFPGERVLTWLAEGFGDAEPTLCRQTIPCEQTTLHNHPELKTIAAVSLAIYRQTPLEISYRSLSSGLTTRIIVPFALADSGLRWHVRAFDRRSQDFRDFVLGRIVDCQPVKDCVADHETRAQDIQWNRIVELELVPHPANVEHPDTIETEYRMISGVLKLRVRASMAGYLLRRFNVDCSKNHQLRGHEFQLWLRNPQTLYGVTNLKLAPGYSLKEQTTPC